MRKEKKYFLSPSICTDFLRINKNSIKIGGLTLITCLFLLMDARASTSSLDDFFFDKLHPTLSKTHREILTPIEYQVPTKIVEHQEAHKVINGVVAMYSENVNFVQKITCYLQLGDYISQVNASFKKLVESSVKNK